MGKEWVLQLLNNSDNMYDRNILLNGHTFIYVCSFHNKCLNATEISEVISFMCERGYVSV